MNLHRRLYDWMLHWAGTPSAGWALFFLSMAEASFFPIPPDVLLAAMVVADRTRAWRWVAICSLGSVIGALIGYLIGWGLWSAVDQFFFDWIPGFSEEGYARVSSLYETYNFWVVFVAGFTPIPFKIFTIAAGIAKISLATFMIAAVVGRTARFALVGGLLYFFGPPIRAFVERHLGWMTLLFAALLIGGFVLVSRLH